MADIPEFTNISDGKIWWRIKGKGWACKVACDKERDRDDPGLSGGLVRIDGELFYCIGVDRFMPAVPIQEGEGICLVVRKATDEEALT